MSLKEVLEGIEIGENKEKLSKEDISKIMKESGKVVNTEVEKVKNEYTTTIEDLKSQLSKAPKSDDIEALKTKIADFEQKEADRVAREEKDKQEAASFISVLIACNVE